MKNKIEQLGISSREAEELINVSKNIQNDYNKLLNKYPIQYLIGYVNFYGYKIFVNENVLIPRFETEFLVEKTINYYNKIFKNKKVDVLDLCSGSGCIGISISKEISSNVTCVDISNEANLIAKNNAIENNSNIKIIESDLFDKVNQKYDIIISNPPYISYDEKIMDCVDKYEPHLALYAEDNGLYFYKEILKQSKKFLNNKFIIAFEIGYWQANLIKLIAKEYFNKEKIIIEKDLNDKDRYLFIINE